MNLNHRSLLKLQSYDCQHMILQPSAIGSVEQRKKSVFSERGEDCAGYTINICSSTMEVKLKKGHSAKISFNS